MCEFYTTVAMDATGNKSERKVDLDNKAVESVLMQLSLILREIAAAIQRGDETEDTDLGVTPKKKDIC